MEKKYRDEFFNGKKYPNCCNHIWENNVCIKCNVKRIRKGNWYFFFLPNGVFYFTRKIRL
jgi:hypothetical protein